ncbi:MAG TPA: alternative ribosome rescue aminoacyl-tRNA hydrolase ArfB [Sedimentisphaerales bacterium]|nr:alternative ribosome rescue aminoacyl-tRNA hydrolase ArfB [Sedimentisphaerales bacterium]
MIEIAAGVHISEDELVFEASRSSGPGGQNVNKVSSRITVLFDIASSPSLSDAQKALVSRRLGNRITTGGVLRVTSQQYRSQLANRQAAVERLAELLRVALVQRPPRKATVVPRSAKLGRLRAKAYRSRLKKLRSANTSEQ